ncbi:MAG: hypothetical protein KDC31_03640 [Saprospiraceae bacterium]|nr:hypothetical protein [Saprospiraceae bacterium]
MTNIKNLLFVFLACIPVLFTACDKDECIKPCAPNEVLTDNCECVPVGDNSTVIVSGNISSDVTWTADKVYVLAQRVTVLPGVKLTIMPGTVIKGQAGSGANATALLIAKGAKIDAQGTVDKPIIFTSVADEIKSGEIVSPNLDQGINGLWGGVLILGDAPISANAPSVQIEGIPPSDINGLYGGNNPQDNSGIMKYVSIRHGGTNIGEGNEINGLTLAGVGSGTIIENIEIVSNQDDGIEIFGGTVNPKNIMVWNTGDDMFDCDQGWSGTMDNIIGIAGDQTDSALELDGGEGVENPTYTISNGTLKGHTAATSGKYADLRAKVSVSLKNLYFFNFSEGSEFRLNDQGVSDSWFSGKILFANLEFNVSHMNTQPSLADIFRDKGSHDEDLNNAAPGFAKISTANTVGARVSEFEKWTLVAALGQLAQL